MKSKIQTLFNLAAGAAAAIVLACCPNIASAVVTTTASEAAWQSSVPLSTRIGFDDLPNGTAVTTQYRVPLGVTFAAFNGGLPLAATESGPHSPLQVLSVEAPSLGAGGGVEVTFDTARSGVGLWYGDSQFVGNSITLYDAAGQMLSSFQMPPGHPTEWLFVGFTSSAADIARMDVSIGANDRVTLDDLQFAPSVPEPASVSLLLAGGLLAAGYAKRRTAAPRRFAGCIANRRGPDREARTGL